MDFTSGLAPGATTFFSLENSPAAISTGGGIAVSGGSTSGGGAPMGSGTTTGGGATTGGTTSTDVPEPATFAVLAMDLFGLVAVLRRAQG